MLFLSVALAADPTALRSGLNDPNGWREVDRKKVDGVGEVVVRHKVVNEVNCLEGAASSHAAPDVLLTAAADITHQPKWSTWNVPVSVRLPGASDAFDYYQLLDNPSPVADRYWFLRASVLRNGGERVFRWELVDPQSAHPAELAKLVAQYPGAVMTQVNLGDWTFTPRSDGTTAVRYRICTDAGGSLPQWLGEFAATRTLPTNVADIVREAQRRSGR